MKKALSKMLAMMLTAALLLSGCGGGTTAEKPAENGETTTAQGEEKKEESKEEAKPEEIKDLVLSGIATSEMETFDILYSQNFSELDILTNLQDPLLEVDTKGKVVACIADEWGTEDNGLNWKFHIRDGVKWVDMNGEEKADVTSYDFATGMEWVLNYYKNDASHTAQPSEMIAGAKEYYEWTKTLTEEEAYKLTADENSKFQEMVGIKTPDPSTIIYTCTAHKPYFDSMATWAGMYPRAQAMIDELGVDGVKAMNNETMWYNGCYTMTSYVQGNEKVLTKNPKYWDTECKRFDTVTTKMVESNDVAYQLYESGEIDYVQLGESRINTIAKDPNNALYNYLVPDVPSKYSYQMQLNYNKKNEDGTPDTNWNTAIANEAFRLSWWYGLDLSNYYKRTNAIDPMSCENNFFTMKGLVYTSDGTEYTELVRQEMGLPELNGKTMVRLDADKAAQYKKQAMEELSAQGVTFPVGVDFYISASSQTALDSANVLAQTFSESLGDDYVKLNIKTFIKSTNQEVVVPHLHSFVINGWGADYGDPQNYLGQMTYGNEAAYYSENYNYINEVEETEATKALIDTYKEFTALVDAANAITDDMDARYKAYAKAEAYMLEHALVFPCYYQIGWCLSKVDNDTKMQPMFGSVGEKMKNWGSNVNGYTSEEKGVAEQIAAFSSEQ